MARDYFDVLGLSPRRHAPREIMRRFVARREQLLRETLDPTRHEESRAMLDELHIALNTLHDPQRQAQYLRARTGDEDRIGELRRLISVSLEGGLLRHSRRQVIIERGGELGLSEFQTQLLIAQVQFGEEEITPRPSRAASRRYTQHPRAWARVAAVGVLALAMFLYLVHWAAV